MNFLAHIFLSDNQPGLLVGNFIADSLKPAHKADLPVPVQQGVALHLAIDHFTDSHQEFKLAKKYSSPIIAIMQALWWIFTLTIFCTNTGNDTVNNRLINCKNFFTKVCNSIMPAYPLNLNCFMTAVVKDVGYRSMPPTRV